MFGLFFIVSLFCFGCVNLLCASLGGRFHLLAFSSLLKPHGYVPIGTRVQVVRDGILPPFLGLVPRRSIRRGIP